jgi:purine-binding chemotaxis protein CheW
MGHQKDKLEAGLDGLFSTPGHDAHHSDQVRGNSTRQSETRQALTPSPSESFGMPEHSEPSAPPDMAEAVLSPESGGKEDEGALVSEGRMPSPRQRTPEAGENGQDEQLVVFRLAGDDYGLSVATVARIIKPPPITVVPRTSRFIEGLTNLRGTVLPVIDLRRRFGLPDAETTGKTRIIVVEMNDIKVGLRVDTVTEVLRVPAEGIEPPSPIVKTVEANFIRGIAKVAYGQSIRLIILLDLARALVTERWGASRWRV